MAEDYEVESKSWLDKIKESPRTVSALIIVLIVVAAVYAFSGDKQEIPDEGLGNAAPEIAQVEDGQDVDKLAENNAGINGDGAVDTKPDLEVVTQEQLSESATQLPEVSRTEASFVEVAQAGDGITHLARRAATRWLSENQTGYEVTNEHRIYIEDYIQNQIGTQGLAIGEQVSVSYDLIQEAVAAAGQLNGTQLQNLTQYTPALT